MAPRDARARARPAPARPRPLRVRRVRLPGRVALVLIRLRRGHVAFIGLALEDRDGRFARNVAEELVRRKIAYASVTLDEIEVVFRNQQRRKAAAPPADPVKRVGKPR